MKRLLLIAFMAASFVGARAQTVSAEVAGPLELSNGLVEDQLFGAGELEGTLTAVEITATYTYGSNAFMQANDLGIFVLNGPTTILQAGGYSQMVIDGEKIDWTNGNTTATPTTFTDMKTLVTPITFSATDNQTVYVGNGNVFGSGTWESITVTLHGVSLVGGTTPSGPELTGTPYAGVTSVNACKDNAATAAAFNSTLALQGYTTDCTTGALTATLTNTATTGSDCNWTVTYTYTVADGCGNSLASQSYSNSGSDQTPPTFSTEPQNQEVECDENSQTAFQAWLSSFGGAVANDSCGDVTFSYSPANPQVDCNESVEVTFTATDECGNSTSSQATFAIGEPVSTDKHQQTKLSLYPNPSGDVLNITCGNETIETVKITDLNGKVIKDVSAKGQAVQVNIADLATGTYIVTVLANGKSNKEKFVRK